MMGLFPTYMLCYSGILVILYSSLRSRKSPYVMCHIHWGSHVEVSNSQISIRLPSAFIMCPPAMQADRVRSPIETCLSRDALLVDSGQIPPWCPHATHRKKDEVKVKGKSMWSRFERQQKCGFLDYSCSL